MVQHKIYAYGQSNKVRVAIPSYLVKKMNLTECRYVDITDENGQIILTPVKGD